MAGWGQALTNLGGNLSSIAARKRAEQEQALERAFREKQLTEQTRQNDAQMALLLKQFTLQEAGQNFSQGMQTREEKEKVAERAAQNINPNQPVAEKIAALLQGTSQEGRVSAPTLGSMQFSPSNPQGVSSPSARLGIPTFSQQQGMDTADAMRRRDLSAEEFQKFQMGKNDLSESATMARQQENELARIAAQGAQTRALYKMQQDSPIKMAPGQLAMLMYDVWKATAPTKYAFPEEIKNYLKQGADLQKFFKTVGAEQFPKIFGNITFGQGTPKGDDVKEEDFTGDTEEDNANLGLFDRIRKLLYPNSGRMSPSGTYTRPGIDYK